METRLDARRAEAFARRMRSQLNEAMLVLMISIAHRTGLLEAMAALPPSTSEAIAAAAGLDERYVREWLAAMVAGRIVDHDGAGHTYHLPREHAACLTRAAGASDLAGRARWIAALGQLEGAVAECFRSGAGLPDRVLAPLRELERGRLGEEQAAVRELLAVRAPDLLDRLEAGMDVLHLGRPCDDHDLAPIPGAGYDLVVAWNVLHDHPSPAQLLLDIHASLRGGGALLCLETAASSNLADNLEHPLGPMLYGTSVLRSLPGAGHRQALGLMWGEDRARRMLAQAGFRPVTVERLEGTDKNCFVARRP